MILDVKKEEQVPLSQPEQALTMPTNEPPSYANESSGSSSAYPSDLKQSPSPLPLPLLLPPLYAPSPSSPFLVASSPSLDENSVPRLSFLALVKAIKSLLQPTPIVRSARTAENVIAHVPGLNLGYRITKWALGGLVLGIVRGGVSALEGEIDGKASRSIGKAQDVIFGASSTVVPKATQDLIDTANSPSGLFPPSSNLLLALVPHSLLSIILSQYEPLLDIPSSVASELIGSNFHASSSKDLTPDQKKALRVRGRIDFKRWGWVRVEGEEEGVVEAPPPQDLDASRSESKDGKPLVRPSSKSASSSITISGGASKSGMFAHVDEKLSARNTRRSSSRKSSQDEGGSGSTTTRGEAGFAIAEEKLGEGTLFLVVVRRRLEGMEKYEEKRM